MQKPPFESGVDGPEQEPIMKTLDAILASEKFMMAPQMSAFLRYVVEQAACGKRHRIKAYTVAVEALGKPESFDPQNDPVVRVLAGRLRSSLNAYNERHPDQAIIIQMNPGSYVPEFLTPSDEDDATSLDATISDEQDDVYMTAANSIISEADLTLKIDRSDIDVLLDRYENERVDTQATPAHQAHRSSVTAQDSPHATNGDAAARIHSQSGTHRPDIARLAPRRLLTQLLQRHPASTLSVGMLLAFLIGISLPTRETPVLPALEAASPSHDEGRNPVALSRQRPDRLSLFIAQGAEDQPLLNQLYGTMSAVMANADDIQLYRLLRGQLQDRYWPEDYLLSLEIVPALDGTRVNVQLLEAQTGRVSHLQVLSLKTDADHRLAEDDLEAIADHARYLIDSNGPLRQDYRAKLSG